MKHITLLILLLMGSTLFAQHSTCDGTRYLSDTFEEFDVTFGMKFGENTTFANAFQELKMDIYEPKGDEAEMRPTIILAFGGSFVAGQRENMAFLCEAFAKKGFVAATIDYRLLDGFAFDSSIVYDAVLRAVGDMAASVRYLREDAATANQFRIDPNYIFAGGISAGAITATHLAYLDEEDNKNPLLDALINRDGGFQNGRFEGNSNANLEYSSAVQGVLNYSGALKDAQWISANEPPCFSAHDDGDTVVPYGKGFSSAFPFGNYMEGSLEMTARFQELGIQNDLLTLEESPDHVSYFNPASPNVSFGEEVVERSAMFLHQLLCNPNTNTKSYAVAEAIALFPNPSTGFVELQLEETIQEYTVQVFDYTGRLVHQVSNTNQLELGHLPKGMYQVAVTSEEAETIAFQKLILQ